MSKSMAFLTIDRLIILALGNEPPTDDEWSGYLKEVERAGLAQTLMLVHTEGGIPTVAQRRRLRRLIGARAVPAAILVTRFWPRVLVRARTCFDPWVRVFSGAGLREAMAFLAIPANRYETIEHMLRLVRSQVMGGGAAPERTSRGA